MESAQELSNRFRNVMLDGLWIANTNFRHQLSDTNITQANAKIAQLNTIALLTFHIDYYIVGIYQFFVTGKLDIHDKYSFDMPHVTSDEDWELRKQQLYQHTEQLCDIIEGLSEQQLSSVFADIKYGTCRRNIEALIEHAYYHLGQVTLINKLINNK